MPQLQGGGIKRDGYYESADYIITWAFGHLFTLADIETYNPAPDGSTRWSITNLPCFPKKYMFVLRGSDSKKVGGGIVKQFNTIKSLCGRDDVGIIVNAGDSDREGEIIIRIIIDHAVENKIRKTMKRLWLPDQTPETIKSALAEMKDESEYDNLAREGYARAFVDWLYGVNLTRYATLKTGTLLRVGRVIVPIVKAIYDRDMAIKKFVPDIYYAVVSKAVTSGEEIELQSKQRFSKDDLDKARMLCSSYNYTGAVVSDVKRRKDTLNPGKLYSLTKLQNMLGNKHKMSMADSLAIVQKLYEEGYVTYPRTNSEYLATAEKDRVKKILSAVGGLGYPVEFKNSKSIFDDSKIESHSALTPTYKIPAKERLSPEEAKVYTAIFRRFVAVFCSVPCVTDKTEIKIDVGGFEQFTLRGMFILEPGWTKYDDYNMKDKILPELKKNDKVNVDFKPVEKETNPLKHYTIETLNNYLRNPFKEDKTAETDAECDDEEYRAIFEGIELGTEATRTGIIDNARKSSYIQLKKDVYTILPDGVYLIEALERMHIGMDKYKTTELGRALKKVYRGEYKISDCLMLAQEEITEVFAYRTAEQDDGYFGDVAGICPLCKGEVKRTKYGYGCGGYKEGCRFHINGIICGKIISLSNARLLLGEGKTSKITGFTSKKGKLFDAALLLENGQVVFDFT